MHTHRSLSDRGRYEQLPYLQPLLGGQLRRIMACQAQRDHTCWERLCICYRDWSQFGDPWGRHWLDNMDALGRRR
jgi:hypothetical protein